MRFDATTPLNASMSASSQVYQVIDYRAAVPAAARATMRRVRALAVYGAPDSSPTADNQYGLRIDAYAGDPAGFPDRGDPETFPEVTTDYQLLTTAENSLLHPGSPEFLPLQTELLLPDDTDFFVVLLEAFENVQNDVEPNSSEFSLFTRVERVEVAIDAGNTPPVAIPDRAATLEDQSVDIRVLINDDDYTSRIDSASVEIVRQPGDGTALANLDGTITYTPDLGFLGNALFIYSVADEEGARSNGASVTVTVVPEEACQFESQFTCTNTDPRLCTQRIVDGNFASTTLNPENLPTQPGLWSGIGMEVVGPSQGIEPCRDTQMLHFVSTADNPPHEISLPLVQLIDLRDADAQAVIAAGDVTLKARALFNRVAGDAETDTQFNIFVSAYDGDPSDYPQQVGTPLGPASFFSLFSDSDTVMWEEAYTELLLDPRTTYVALRLLAYENVVNDFPLLDPNVVEFDGHYMDGVQVMLDRE